MATIYKEFTVQAPLEQVWDALRDFGAVHTRLAPGFVNACTLAGNARDLVFANGLQVRETLVGLDPAHHRLSYTVKAESIEHHNASAQLFASGPQQTRFVWIADVLPDELAGYIGAMMDDGCRSMSACLEQAMQV